MDFDRFTKYDENGFISKRYVISFIIIFCLLSLLLLIFFYFNIILVAIIVGVIITCIVIYFVTINANKYDVDDDGYVEDEEVLESKVQENDENFTLDSFYVYVKDTVNLVCRSYSKNNFVFLDNFLGKDLINEIKTNIINYNKEGYSRKITGVNVRDCKLVNYYKSGGYEYFEVDVSISKIDCVVQNGVVVSGDSNNGIFLDYNLVYCRSLKEYIPVDVLNCPVCGSNKSNFNDGKCLKCGQIVSNLDGFYLIKFDDF